MFFCLKFLPSQQFAVYQQDVVKGERRKKKFFFSCDIGACFIKAGRRLFEAYPRKVSPYSRKISLTDKKFKVVKDCDKPYDFSL